MLRFAEDTVAPLATHLFVIDVHPDELTVTARQIFPESSPDPALLKNIELFSFPDPCAIESNCFFHFAIGDTAGDFHLGFVQFTSSYAAKVLLSNFYYPSLFKSLLALPVNELLSQLRTFSIPQLRPQVSVGGHEFFLDGSRERQELWSLMFTTFSPFDISKIIVGMLQARHIYVVASAASVCSRMVAALPLLIDPFRWDMNCIPVLPMKLKEAAQVPVPTLIGLTHAEVLLEGRVESRIIVNPDMHLVIDKPPLDLLFRFRVIQLQLDFHRIVLSTLSSFDGCPGFPHRHIQKVVQRFLFQYFTLFTGQVATQEQFLKSFSRLPECLESSQVVHDLFALQGSPVAEEFGNWLGEMFKTKTTTVKRVTKRMAQSSSQPGLASLAQEANEMLIDFGPVVQPAAPNRPNRTQPAGVDLFDLFAPPAAAPRQQQAKHQPATVTEFIDILGPPVVAPKRKLTPQKSGSNPDFNLLDFPD
jgi:hypothetical protein